MQPYAIVVIINLC